MIWYDMMWYDIVSYDMISYDIMSYGMRYEITWHDVMFCVKICIGTMIYFSTLSYYYSTLLFFDLLHFVYPTFSISLYFTLLYFTFWRVGAGRTNRTRRKVWLPAGEWSRLKLHDKNACSQAFILLTHRNRQTHRHTQIVK